MYKIVIILLFICSSISAQFISEFETGYLKFDNKTITPYSQASYQQETFYSKFYFGYQYKNFKFLTETDIYFYKKAGTKTFSPIQSQFFISIEYKFKNITFGYSHLCGHPIDNKHHDYVSRKLYYESYDKIFIRVKLVGNNP